MKLKISIGAKKSVTIFACLGMMFCHVVLAAEQNGNQFISKATVVVDNYQIAVMNNLGTGHTAYDQRLFYAVRTTGNTDVNKVWLPMRIEYAYQVELFDANRISVSKSAIGKSAGINFFDLGISKGYITPRSSKPQQTGAFRTNEISFGWYELFRPSDLFEIKKPGNYNLQIRFQMVAPVGNGTNQALKVIRFAPLDFPIMKPD